MVWEFDLLEMLKLVLLNMCIVKFLKHFLQVGRKFTRFRHKRSRRHRPPRPPISLRNSVQKIVRETTRRQHARRHPRWSSATFMLRHATTTPIQKFNRGRWLSPAFIRMSLCFTVAPRKKSAKMQVTPGSKCLLWFAGWNGQRIHAELHVTT